MVLLEFISSFLRTNFTLFYFVFFHPIPGVERSVGGSKVIDLKPVCFAFVLKRTITSLFKTEKLRRTRNIQKFVSSSRP